MKDVALFIEILVLVAGITILLILFALYFLFCPLPGQPSIP
jgi:uncharacterized membrane protein